MEDPLFQEIYKVFFGDDRQPSEEVARLTEDQWRDCGDPRVLLDFLRGKISNRQLNLFAAACCRRAWTMLAAPSQAAIEATERFVDGYLSEEQHGFAVQAAIDMEVGFIAHRMDLTEEGTTPKEDSVLTNRLSAAASAVIYGLSSSPLIGTYTPDTPEQDRGIMAMVSHITVAITGRASDPAEFALQCGMLRGIVGDPFHPVAVDPAWQTTTVMALAQAIYAERTFDRMSILADALEDAGCNSEGILGHCRGPGPHVRGCCVLDLLMAGRFPTPSPATAFVEIPPIEKRKEEYAVDGNERCYRCRFHCSGCGSRLILLYPRDDNPPQLEKCPFCEFGNPTVTVDRLEPFGETEWFAGDDCEAMTRWVDDHFGFRRIGRLAVLRKSRLFACQCCRFLWPALTHPDSRTAVEVAENFAERTASKAELQSAFKKANTAAWATGNTHDPAWAANNAASDTPLAIGSDQLLVSGKSDQSNTQLIAAWLWDIFGNPFRPVSIDPSWQTATVTSLAQAIYDERAFDRMPALADALEDAGCTNHDILAHCRQLGEHARGCWVVDLLLGKS
jgi:hypothetical protein